MITWQERRKIEDDLFARLGEPKDDMERSYFHYICFQVENRGSDKAEKKRQLSSALCLLPFRILFRLRGRKAKKPETSYDAACYCPNPVFTDILMSDLPPEVQEEYPNRARHSTEQQGTFGRYGKGMLDDGAYELWKEVARRYPKDHYFQFYMLLHLGLICQMIYTYNPRAIISAQTEFDFSSSLLSYYCEKQGMEYIGIMHGETVRNLNRAYVRFSRFYSWNPETVDLFVATNSPRDSFRIYETNRLKTSYRRKEHPEYFLSYYMSAEKEADMVGLRKKLEFFTDLGLRCKLRYHPRATDQEAMKRVFEGSAIEIENPKAVPLQDSVENAEFIVSVCSTVLSESYMSGLKIVIDDMDGYMSVDELRDRMYINLDRRDYFLSELKPIAESRRN